VRGDGLATGCYHAADESRPVSLRRRLAWLAVYALSMGWLEAAVVVYLRALYYPGGFEFPLAPMPGSTLVVEIGREAATLAMILAVAVVAGSAAWDRFLNFAYIFGIWDLVYYAGLRAALGWPPNLMTPDVLFLIPLPWVGPVLAPVIVSLLLVVGSVLLLRQGAGGGRPPLTRWGWAAAVSGGLVVLLAFVVDGAALLQGGPAPPFRWGLFGSGVVLGVVPFALGAARFRGIMKGDREPRGARDP
jgi:hypothetical protein